MFRFAVFAAAAPLFAQGSAEFFERRIRPVLAEKCYSCHNASKATSGLALDSRAAIEKGGSRGALFAAGDPGPSLILRAITHAGGGLKMPPGEKLPDAVAADFREWIASGAALPGAGPAQAMDWERARQHWSFRPVRAYQPPAVRSTAWPRTEVDSFLLARMEAEGLAPAAPASKRDWLRRVTFDLTGLPPTPREIEDFLRDDGAEAHDRAIERLLASPHYGERQARHWLDLVRFAETNGHEFDFYKYEAWRYRDYVIRAFNQDVPYDRFAAEHIAGDLLPSPRLAPGGHWDSIIGSGFLGLQEERNGATDLEEVRTEMRDSKIDVLGKAFLGLTVACARCHDHKFDPISTKDYYALGGILDSTRTTLGSIESPDVARLTEAEVVRFTAARPAAPELRPRDGDEPFDDFRNDALGKWHRSGGSFRKHDGLVLDSSRGVSNRLTGILVSRGFVPKHKYIHVLVGGTKFNPVREEPSLLAVTIFAPGRYPKGVAGDGTRSLRWKTITLKEEINQVCHLEIADRQRDGHIAVGAIVFSNHKEPPGTGPGPLPELAAAGGEANPPVEPFGRVSYEDNARDMRVHVRGNHLAPGEEVPRGFLSVLGGGAYRDGSGRKGLAEAIASPDNPLVARVMANRIWKRHFGEGLVATVDNFGRIGERPSHPELLDYLARRFVDSGWSVKAMHRLIARSAAYRMASAPSAKAREADPRNRLLSYVSTRRLDAESIRDAILSASGSLQPAIHGPSVTPNVSPWQDGRGKPETGPLDGGGRRSIYIEVRRNFLTPMLLAFDYPLPTTTVGRRAVSSVPAQALTMMNNEFVARQSELWAERMTADFHDPKERLDAMYARAYSRPPEPGERTRIEEFVASGGTWTEVAHALLNAKEFLFVR